MCPRHAAAHGGSRPASRPWPGSGHRATYHGANYRCIFRCWRRKQHQMTDTVAVGTSHRALPAGTRPAGAEPPQAPDARQVMAEIRALGPVEAVVADQLVDLGAPKQRALLALLVSLVGEPVAVDVILEALWAGHPPPSAMTSLQAYVANLR